MKQSRSSLVTGNGVDRISNLPEPLLHHILSFLNMKYVVQTCVLSKRWRYVWPSVSNLDFNGSEFEDPEGEQQLNNFKKFVNKVLMLRGFHDIQQFYLDWWCGYSQMEKVEKIVNEHLNTWILVVLKCNVQHLSINIGVDEDCRHDLVYRFPHSLFNSQSLSKLVLEMTSNRESQVILPKSMDLPRLRYLSLGYFFVEDGDSINQLISSCPILESLILKNIWIKDGYDMSVNIESRELKHLETDNNDTLVWPHYNMAKVIKLSTPNLTSFVCKDFMLQEYRLENVSSLLTAEIDIVKENEAIYNSHLGISEEQKLLLYPKRMRKFIEAFHNVKEITISSPEFLQVLAGTPDLIECRFPQFGNLQCLKLKTWFTSRCLLAITYLLKSCPGLEFLYLTSEKPNYQADKDGGAWELSVSCILPHLKCIKIRDVEGSDTEVEFLGMLLINAVVLAEMVLSFTRSPGRLERLKFSEKLKKLPRASPSLVIIFL